MKKLYLIGGPMGVGKTAVCQAMKRRLDRSVFLDGDWCWDMNPFTVTEETKAMVINNISHLLAGFLRCSEFDHVIFCWVMHEQAIIDDILTRLPADCCEVFPISLTASPDVLSARIQSDVDAGLRTPDVTGRSLARLPLYDELATRKIDTSALSIDETLQRILHP